MSRGCMDQTTVDVTDIENVNCSDAAVATGKSDALEITAYDLAEQSDTITNGILSRLGTRLNRIMV